MEEEPIFVVCDEMASFPGGVDSMYAFLRRNITYPTDRGECIGRVYVKLVVEKDGSITQAKVIRDIGCGCGEEALRVVNAMPKWVPAKARGYVVRSYYTIPIRFALEG